MSKHKKYHERFWGIPNLGEKSSLKQTKRLSAKVIERKELGDNLLVLTVRPEQPLLFNPGEYVKLYVDGIKRRYSIVSAPHEEVLEFCIERVPGGKMTTRLWNLQWGDDVTLRTRVKGKLTLDLRYPAHFMVATVTGVAPFVSMIRACLHAQLQGHKFYLLHGASYCDELVYQGELERLAVQHPDLVTYVPALSRPTEERNGGWTGETGRVSGLVSHYLERFALSPRSTVLYACGHPEMVETVKKRGKNAGFHVYTERYWKA